MASAFGCWHAAAFGLLSFFEARWRRIYGGVPV